jgi:hypothetical protein
VATNGNKWQQMATNGNKWQQMATNGDRWRQMATNGDRWRQMATNGDRWRQMPQGLKYFGGHSHLFDVIHTSQCHKISKKQKGAKRQKGVILPGVPVQYLLLTY